MEQRGPAYLTTGQFAPQALGRRDRPEAVQNARHQAYDMRMQSRQQQNMVGPVVHVLRPVDSVEDGCLYTVC